MNDIDFKNTLIKAIQLDKTHISIQKRIVSVLSKSNIYIEYTSLFTRIEWNTYCAILHIQSPVDDYEFMQQQENFIFSFADKIFGKQEDHLLTDIEIGIIIQKGEIIDFSSIKTTEIVEKAIEDAELFMNDGKYSSALDRIHTALHGYIRKKLTDLNEPFVESDTLSQLYTKLHCYVSRTMSGEIADLIKTTLRSSTGVIAALNDLRNRHTLAHPNDVLVCNNEAKLCINMAKVLSDYIELVI